MAHQQPQSGAGVEPTVQQPMPSHRQGRQVQGVQYAGSGYPGPGPTGPTQFEDPLPNPVRWALYDLHKVAQQGRWCATQCRQEGPEMTEIARVVEELAELAELNERLIARESPHGPTMARAFVDAAGTATGQLASHPSGHVQGTRRVLERAIDSTTRALETVEGGGPGTPTAGGTPGFARPGRMGTAGTGQSRWLEAPETGLGAPTLPPPP